MGSDALANEAHANADLLDEVLDFWFAGALESSAAAEARNALWFGNDEEFDRQIRARFGALPERAARGELDGWLKTPRGVLAMVIVLDQFPRNLHRGSAQAFAYDAAARAAATLLISRGLDETLHPIEAGFLYLPFEHSEDLLDSQRSLELYRGLEERVCEEERGLFEGMTDWARRHYDIIARFGRFPHRNEVLEREPTEEERRYLAEGGDRF